MKEIRYFNSYGSQHTEEVIEIIKKRLEVKDIKTVIVASTTGETGVKFARELKNYANLIVVSHKEMYKENKEEIKKLGAKALDKTHLALHQEGMDDIREAYRTLGQGFKVAVEIMLIAADLNEIDFYTDVISIGGTAKGADTAIIIKTTSSKEIFSSDRNKKMEIREILAMPLEKKWW